MRGCYKEYDASSACFKSSNSRRRDAEPWPRCGSKGRRAVEAVQSHFRARSGRPLAAFPPISSSSGRFGGDQGEEVVVRRRGDDAVDCIATADWPPWR